MTEAVTVIGGGVIGLASAHYLAAAGLRVTVLERDRVGSGASRGNAGEICPDLVEPLPAPGVIGPALRTLHRPDSALFVRPRPDADLLRFLLGFTRNATRARYTAGAAALARLSTDTRALFDQLGAAGVDANTNKDGFLFAFASAASARAAAAVHDRLGAPRGDLLGPAGLRDLEPCLSDGAQAGFLVRDQWCIDPNLFVDRLAEQLRSRAVTIVEGARVTGIDSDATGVRVHTSAGTVDGDTAVLAAGVWSRAIGRRLGVDLNIFPGKGYSFSVRVKTPPARLVHLGDAHVAVTPMGRTVRLAGTMELDREHDRFDPRRIAAIVAATRPYLSDVDWTDLVDEWVGARPMTPDGLPAIGRFPGHRNVFVAAGHNMLGLMLAPATGRLVADMVTGTARSDDWAAFDPARIGRRWNGHEK